MTITLEVTIHISKFRKTFLVMEADGDFEETIGIADGIHYAIEDYVENFNSAGYLDEDRLPMKITNENIRLKERPYRMVHI